MVVHDDIFWSKTKIFFEKQIPSTHPVARDPFEEAISVLYAPITTFVIESEVIKPWNEKKLDTNPHVLRMHC